MHKNMQDLNLFQIVVSNNKLLLHDEQDTLCDTFRLIHSQYTKNFVDLQRRDTFYIWDNTSHLGLHHVLPTGRCPFSGETFRLKLLDCPIFFSHSPWCFLVKVLLFSLAALPVHQKSLLCFADQPLCTCMCWKWLRGSINKCTNRYPQISPRPLSVCI